MIDIINSDCLKSLDTMKDESVDLIVTDPPYKISARGNCGTMGGMMATKLSMEGKVFTHNDIRVSDYAGKLYRVLKSGSHLYIMCNHINLIEMLNELTGVGFHFIKSLIWNKCNKISGQFYMSQFEYILFFRKGPMRKINNCGTSDILTVENRKHKDYDGTNLHDSEKPVALMRILIENSSDVGDLILDPFVGSGTSALACMDTDRNFIGYEIDKSYYELALSRKLEKERLNKLALF